MTNSGELFIVHCSFVIFSLESPVPRSPSEIHPRINHKASRPGRSGDAAKVASAVDVQRGICEVGSIEDVDRIQAQLEFFVLVDLGPFDHVEFEAKGPRSSERRQSQRADFSRLWIDQNRLTIWTYNRFVVISGAQSVQRRNTRKTGVRNLRISVEVHDAVGEFRHLAGIPREGADD